MKLYILFLLVSLCIGFTLQKQSNNNTRDNIVDMNFKLVCPPSPTFEQSIKTGAKEEKNEIDRNWYSKAMENIQKEEYNISYSEELKSYQSPNRASNIRFIYHNDGFTAKTRDNRIPLFDLNDKTIREEDKRYEVIDEWSIDFKMRDVSREKISNCKLQITNNSTSLCSPLFQREDGGVLISGSELIASGNTASIEDENMRIDYTNDKKGMRQDFIIKNKPEGEGKLRLNLSAETKLKMIVGADALMFKDKNGEDKMKYSALKVFDANGKELRAYFEESPPAPLCKGGEYLSNLKQSKIKNLKSKIKENPKSQIPNSKSFSIVVKDEDAVYPITIDPLSSSPDWSETGGYSFGNSVSTAGDVNGDGYSDVIIGAPFTSVSEGKVYVYYGSATGLSLTANWSVTYERGFGFSVSTAGDVNGDGYSDLIIANPFHVSFGIRGRVYIFFGSASGPSNSPDWNTHGSLNTYFGYSVSTAGDVNGDGYSDILIGAPGGDLDGKAYVWYGSSAGLGQDSTFSDVDWETQGGSLDGFLGEYGSSVSTAGDINGDGYSDVIVSEPGYTSSLDSRFEGKVFVFYGSDAGLSSTSNWSAESNVEYAQFGTSVSTAGDVNGDGYSDIIISEASYDNGQENEGAAFVWYGSQSGFGSSGTHTNADWSKGSNQDSAFFGSSVSTAGDVNGDGYSDLIIGATLFDNGQENEGKVFAYFGSASGPSSTADWTEEINNADAHFGGVVSIAGDVNGDGYSDVIVGATGYGGAFVYHGFPSGLSGASDWTLLSNQTAGQFGYSVSLAGDVNGDGYSDVIIGAPFADNGQTDEGRVFVYHGSSSGLSTSNDWSEEINQASANFGNSVSTAGDVNGDGYSDVIIGAYKYDNNHTDEGKAFVYHGSATGLSASSSWQTYGAQANAKYGSSVSTAGDVNGDGYSDVVVGAPFYNHGQSDEGIAYVFYGSIGGLSLSNWDTESNQAGANLGFSVSTAGDVNGDGFSDLIIGVPNYDNGVIDKGIVLVFHGSPQGLPSSPNWSATKNQSLSGFGWSVSCAGDVNGDGYSDVIIGAPYFDNSTNNSGKAFVYHGSESGLSATNPWNNEGTMSNEQLGYCVSNAGDVNGDGYSDVIVGAPYYDNGQSFEGRALLFQGSPSGLTTNSKWSFENNLTNSTFGYCVSSAGDVNGDGYSDVIVGAPGGQITGRSYSFYGNSGTGLRSTVRQYKPSSSNIVYSGGLTGSDGDVRLNIFGRSPFGRAVGKIVYEYKKNGDPFSGSVITNSVSSSGNGGFTGLLVSGVQLNREVSGLIMNNEYKWRARVQYKMTTNPYQKFGPWKYYTNYVPVPFGCFKAQNSPLIVTVKSLSLTMFIEGFYDVNANTMLRDTARVFLRYSTSPYTIADSSKKYIGTAGGGTFSFANSSNGINYYIQLKHRNSIETWSATGQSFSSDALTYNFSDASTKAFGDNMKQIDTSPVRFGIFSGDENQDGSVDVTDMIDIYNDLSNSGYVPTDINGDDFVDVTDLIITYNNANNVVGVITP